MNNSQNIPQSVQQQQQPMQLQQQLPQSTPIQPVQQQQQQNVQQQHATHVNPNQSTQSEIINKTRKLINDLKASLANLMSLLAKNISYNYQIDSGQKINTEKSSRFDKAWGEFNSICNQVEAHFKTLQECALLKKDSKNFIPFDLAQPLSQIDSQLNNTITYGHYVNLVKNQVNYSKAIQEILADGARKISQMEPMQMNQQNMHNQQHSQHSYHQMQQQNHQKANQMMNQITPNSYQMQIANHQSPMMGNQMIPQSPMMQQQLNNQQQQQMNPMQPTYQQMPQQQINNQMKYNQM